MVGAASLIGRVRRLRLGELFALGVSSLLSSAAQADLMDVQVGERGDLMRIALICDGACSVLKVSGTSYRIDNIEKSLEIPLQERSALVRSLQVLRDDNGGVISIVTDRSIASSRVRDCDVGSSKASCIDLNFAPIAVSRRGVTTPTTVSEVDPLPEVAPGNKTARAAPDSAPAPSIAPRNATRNAQATGANGTLAQTAPSTATAPSKKAEVVTPTPASARIEVPAPTTKPTAKKPDQPATKPAQVSPQKSLEKSPPPRPQLRGDRGGSSRVGEVVRQSARPTLREAPNAKVLTFTRYEPLDPSAPTFATVTPLRKGAIEPTLTTLRPGEPKGLPRSRIPRFDQSANVILPSTVRESAFAARSRVLLGKAFDEERCERAKAQLDRDAWALDAMADVGFCFGADGDLERADRIFARLIDFSPENYEALIGRAIVALEAGEKNVAKRFFQDALEAPAPIAQATRIENELKRL